MPDALELALKFLSAAAGLGTAAMGVVDSMKAWRGGPSNFGFKRIEEGVTKFLGSEPAEKGIAFGQADILATLKSNWINGVPKAEQKAKAKSLIHLNLTTGNAKALAAAAGVDPEMLAALATKIAKGEETTKEEINALGQFDAVLSAVLDNAYERGDQQYRNGSKALAMVVATLMSVIGAALIGANIRIAVLIGISATSLAPIAKDLSTTLQAAATAARLVRR